MGFNSAFKGLTVSRRVTSEQKSSEKPEETTDKKQCLVASVCKPII